MAKRSEVGGFRNAMLRKLLFVFITIFVALVVLSVSIFRTTVARYDFSGPNNSASGAVFSSGIEYSLPYPGILPSNPFWFLKAGRDRFVLFLTPDPLNRANRLLLLADQRLSMSRSLAIRENLELAVPTAERAETYLEDALVWGKEAQVRGYNMDGFFETLAKSSLAHREILEKMVLVVPEKAGPMINQSAGRAEKVYERTSHAINERGKTPPVN